MVIGNNTAIFATLSSLRKHGKKQHPSITFICPEFWLDRTHTDYASLDWGQTIYGLPKFAREIFKSIYPDYPEDKFITWAEYQELRQAGIHELKSQPNITVYNGLPEIHSKKSGEYSIDINTSNSQANISIPSNAFFYNWHRTHIRHDLEEIIQRSHTELYTLSISTLPKQIIVLGHGLSVVWLEKHFPEISFINIKNRRDKLPNLPSNTSGNFQRVIIHNKDEVTLKTISSNPGQVILILNNDPTNGYTGEFYSAIGLSSMPQLTEKLSKDAVEVIPMNYKIENWIAPSNIPFGSLMESFSRWIEVTGNLVWAHEPQAYHNDHFPLLLRETMLKKGICLTSKFFDKLEGSIKKLSNPLNDADCYKLFIDVFKTVSTNTEKELFAFTDCLKEMQENRDFVQVKETHKI